MAAPVEGIWGRNPPTCLFLAMLFHNRFQTNRGKFLARKNAMVSAIPLSALLARI
jgi:hypothetical protein